jgi:hypothetical protein
MTLTKHSTFDALQLLFKGTPDLNLAEPHDSKAVLSMFAARILAERRYAGEGDHTGRQLVSLFPANIVMTLPQDFRTMAIETLTAITPKKANNMPGGVQYQT